MLTKALFINKELEMEQSPYTTPEANLESSRKVDIPEQILKRIKYAWVAGVISISITILLTLISMSGTDILGLDAWAFLDVALMTIFVFGIYKKSRVCAILMLSLFSANKIIMWLETGAISGLPLALVFLWFYTQGVIGTFQYHRLVKSQKKATEELNFDQV